MKKALRVSVLLGGVILIFAGLIWLMAKSAALGPQSFSSGIAPEITASDWTDGNKTAKVTLIEYGDYQCPACGAYYPIVKQVANEYRDRILFVFRNFPLTQHQNALPAAYAAEAAGLQGKFWEMLGLIYENQKSWSDFSGAENKFETYASQIGLNLNKFRSDRDSQAVKDKVQKDLSGGLAAQVDHTPTFFINLKQIPNPISYEDFKSKLDQALSAK